MPRIHLESSTDCLRIHLYNHVYFEVAILLFLGEAITIPLYVGSLCLGLLFSILVLLAVARYFATESEHNEFVFDKSSHTLCWKRSTPSSSCCGRLSLANLLPTRVEHSTNADGTDYYQVVLSTKSDNLPLATHPIRCYLRPKQFYTTASTINSFLGVNPDRNYDT